MPFRPTLAPARYTAEVRKQETGDSRELRASQSCLQCRGFGEEFSRRGAEAQRRREEIGESFALLNRASHAGSLAEISRAEAPRRRGGREGMGEGFAPGRCSYRAGSVANGSRAEALRRRGGREGMGESFALLNRASHAGSLAEISRAEALRRRGEEKEWVSASRFSIVLPMPGFWRRVLPQRRGGAEEERRNG